MLLGNHVDNGNKVLYIILFFKNKLLPYGKGADFMGGLCIIFSVFFNVVVFYELQI